LLAARIVEGFQQPAVDGAKVMPPWIPAALDAFFSNVVPLLQERGVFRTAYQADTLRGHPGLERRPC